MRASFAERGGREESIRCARSGKRPGLSFRMAILRPTTAQRRYLRRGLKQPGGKLPLFDEHGQQISMETIRACIRHGWAEPWFANPIKPDWLVCKLTVEGRSAIEERRIGGK